MKRNVVLYIFVGAIIVAGLGGLLASQRQHALDAVTPQPGSTTTQVAGQISTTTLSSIPIAISELIPETPASDFPPLSILRLPKRSIAVAA